MAWPQFDEALFKSNLHKQIQRKDVGDLDGAHYRELFVKWKDVIYPSLKKCQKDVKGKLKEFFKNWGEVCITIISIIIITFELKQNLKIQWLMYLPEEARILEQHSHGLRLRCHLLAFQHLTLCRSLFRSRGHSLDPSDVKAAGTESKMPPGMKKDSLVELLEGMIPPEEREALASPFKKKWNKLNCLELWSIFWKQPIAPRLFDETSTNKKRKRDPLSKKEKVNVMDLYLHSIVSHMGPCFETLDLRNMSTERPEAFFARVKRLLAKKSNRKFNTLQPVGVIYESIHSAAVSTINKQKDHSASRISKAFHHEFKEIIINLEDIPIRQDTNALLRILRTYGYRDEIDWNRVGDIITFNTKGAVKKIFERYSTIPL